MKLSEILSRIKAAGIQVVLKGIGKGTGTIPTSLDEPQGSMNLLELIDRAKDERAQGNLVTALDLYTQALRKITPDDKQIERAISIVGLGGKGRCDYPDVDKLDSRLRSEIVAILIEMRHYDKAYHHACIALYLDVSLYGKRSNDTSSSYHDLGMIQKARRKINEALKFYRESEEIDKSEAVQKENPDGVEFRSLRRAAEKADLGFMEESARFYKDSLTRIDQWNFDAHRKAGIINIGTQCLQNLGEHALAQKYLARAISIQQSIGAADPLLGVLYSNMACLLQERCDFKGADKYKALANSHTGYINAYGRSPRFDQLGDDREKLERWIENGRRNESSGHNVFMSFSVQDDDIVEQLCESLGKSGLSIWKYRRDKGTGVQLTRETILKNLHEAIDLCQLAVIVSTGSAIASEWVYAEIKHSLSRDIPVVVWYPEGVRLCPIEAATWTNTSSDRLADLTLKFFGPGIYSYFAYGLRDNNISVIADAIIKRFVLMFPNHTLSKACAGKPNIQNALDGTLMPPVFVDKAGNPLVPEIYGIGG